MVDQAEIHRMAQSKYPEERREAVEKLGSNFENFHDRKLAWDDLHRLTQDSDSGVRWRATDVLGSVFPHTPDKKQAWNDMHRLTQDSNRYMREFAAYSIGSAFQHIPHRELAWDDLILLTQDSDSYVKWGAAEAIGLAFLHVPDRKQAWNDLHRMTQDGDSYIRKLAAYSISIIFQRIPDRKQAWDDLHRLTQDSNSYVALHAAKAIGTIFQHIPDRKQAWDDLHRLTQDSERDVRLHAYHSSGRASIFEASEAETQDLFSTLLKKAIRFFEKTSKEATYYNPAQFCLPFYRSFHVITFKKEEVEGQVQQYLAEAKRAIIDSDSKERLLEAVENLANALTETQKAREMDLESKKFELNAIRRYCDRAAELIETTEEKAPGATRLIRKGMPIIDERIKGIIAEIQEKSKVLCKRTKGTSFEDLGKEIHQQGQSLSKIKNPIILEKSVDNMLNVLDAFCSTMPEVCKLLKKANEEQYIEDRINWINMALGSALSQVPSYRRIQTTLKEVKADTREIRTDLKEMNDGLVRIEANTDNIIEYIQKIKTSCVQIIDNLDESGVPFKKEDKEELKTLADELKRANKEQLTIFANELVKLLENHKFQNKIEKEAQKKLAKRTLSKTTDIVNEIGIALSAAVTAEEMLPHIEAIIHQITILSGISPGLASTLILIPLIALKKKTVK